MRKNNTMGLLFPSMHDEALREATLRRALGSVPFGGRYRLIDFTLSNMVNGGVGKVGIITKRNYQSLMDHIGSGRSWDLSRKNDGLYFLPPQSTADDAYNGRIDSLDDIRTFLSNSSEEYVIMSDCNVVSNMDYTPMLEQHIQSGADITIACQVGTYPASQDVLCLHTDDTDRITDLTISRMNGGEGRFGLGLYVLRRVLLMQLVDRCICRNLHNFERDVLQALYPDLRIYAYEVPELTMVISSVGEYFEANMRLLDADVRSRIFTRSRSIYTKVYDCAPALYGLHASVSNSLIADGAVVDGNVSDSVIFRDVRIGRGSTVENCVIMQGTVIGENVHLSHVILDKNVVVSKGQTLQGSENYPVYIVKGSEV